MNDFLPQYPGRAPFEPGPSEYSATKSMGFLGIFEILHDNCKMRIANNWILMAQIRVVTRALSPGNRKKTIIRKGRGKCMNIREEKLEPSHNKAGQNREVVIWGS